MDATRGRARRDSDVFGEPGSGFRLRYSGKRGIGGWKSPSPSRPAPTPVAGTSADLVFYFAMGAGACLQAKILKKARRKGRARLLEQQGVSLIAGEVRLRRRSR